MGRKGLIRKSVHDERKYWSGLINCSNNCTNRIQRGYHYSEHNGDCTDYDYICPECKIKIERLNSEFDSDSESE